MRWALLVGIAGALGACASDGAQMAERHPVFRSYRSALGERETATCIQKAVSGASVELGEGRTVVAVKNQFGTSLIGWYVKAAADGGSQIEVRRAQSIAGGIEAAEACFVKG